MSRSDSSSLPHSPPRLLQALRRRAEILSWAAPAACLALWLPGRIWILELARHFYLYGLSVLVILTILCAVLRLWKTAALQFAAALLMAWPLRSYYVSPPVNTGVPAEAGNSLSLLSCNLLLTPREPEQMKAALLKADPDVLLLLEFTPEWQALLQPVLARYPHQTGRAQNDPFGIWLASRFPLENPQVTYAIGNGDPFITARLRLASRSVDLTAAHPFTPVRSAWFDQTQRQFAVYQKFFDKNSAGAQIMVGDLNCTPFALNFQDFLRATGLRDSAEGRGLTATWFPSVLPWQLFGLPIDHVLVSPQIKVLERSTGPPTGSDHRWVRVRLAVE